MQYSVINYNYCTIHYFSRTTYSPCLSETLYSLAPQCLATTILLCVFMKMCECVSVCVCEVGQGFFGGLAVKDQPYLCIFKYIKECIYLLLTDIVPYWAHKVSPLLKKKKTLHVLFIGLCQFCSECGPSDQALALLGFVLKLKCVGLIKTHNIIIHQGWDQATLL